MVVARYPIETWTRPQLEDNFHNVVEEARNLQKKVKEQEKQLTSFNSRFRKNLLEKKHRDDVMIEREKYDDVVKENKILDMKLKAAKHQLLIYTAPSARAATASAITGRSTFRQPPSTWRQRGAAPFSGVSIDRPISVARKKPESGEKLQLGAAATDEKLMIVRLNRTLKNRNEQITELQYTIEKLKEQLSRLRSGKPEIQPTTTSQSRLSTSSSSKSGNNENFDGKDSDDNLSEMSSNSSSAEIAKPAKKVKKAKVSDGASRTPKSAQNADEKVLSDRLKMAENDLELLRNECEVLKNANERLVQQSLTKSTDYGARESLEEKKKIIELEENLKEIERKLKETEQKRKEEQKKFEAMRQHYLKKSQEQKGGATAPTVIQTQRTVVQEPSIEELLERTVVPTRNSKVSMTKMRKHDDDVLNKLYLDVAEILTSHDVDSGDGRIEGVDLNKWQKLYAELYEELEKVRNMLLIQHDINEKQCREIRLLQDELERIKTLNIEKMTKMKEVLEEKQRKVFILEEQIRQIAYSGQQPISLLAGQIQIPPENASLNTDLSIKLVSCRPAASLTSKFFFSLEFFDFQLETTPILEPKQQKMDFTTIYDVVVSNLLIHYLQTNGITIELYKPSHDSYQLLAAGTISLIPLFEDNVQQRFCSEITIKSLDTAEPLCTLVYEIQISSPFSESFSKFKKSEIARTIMPSVLKVDDTAPEVDKFEPLMIMVNRVNGVEQLGGGGKREKLEFCVVYELLTFSPYFTDFSTDSEIRSIKEWSIPKSETARELFRSTSITFYLIENVSKQDGVLSMLNLPLASLCKFGGQIKGTFPMVDIQQNPTGVSLDVCLAWKHQKPAFLGGPETPILAPREPEPVLAPVAAPASEPVKRLSKQFEVTPVILEDVLKESQPSTTTNVMHNSAVVEKLLKIQSPSSESSMSSFSTDSSSKDVFSPPMKNEPSIFDYNFQESSSPRKEPEIEEIESVSAKSSYREKEEEKEEVAEKNLKIEEIEENAENEMDSTSSTATTATTLKSLPPPPEEPPIPQPATEPEPELASPKELQKSPEPEKEENLKKEKDVDEIKSLLGVLPPIAAPRKLAPIEEPSSHRNVIFTEPLHRSIPPSESSSTSSPRRAEKGPVPLPAIHGQGVIKIPEPMPIIGDDEPDSDLTVIIRLERFESVQFSRLLMKYFEKTRVVIDWNFLDFSVDTSKSYEFQLPTKAQEVIELDVLKEYILSRKQFKLLDQWIELNNKLEFNLTAVGPNEEEELAVAQLTLVRNNSTNNPIAIDFLDINGEHLAELQLSVIYSQDLLDLLK